MNISFDKTKLEVALQGIDDTFRDQIINLYIELKKRHLKSFFGDEFDAVGISVGKFCEILFRFLELEIFGTYTSFSRHISNFPQELNKLIQAPVTKGNDSIRIIIPRALSLLYTLRNKRGIGHVGGDVQANSIDIGTIVKIADWIICELIRIYHDLSLNEAQSVVDSLNIKLIPVIWSINGKRRVIKSGLSYGEKVLVLIYNELENKATVQELFEWSEYSSPSMFKSNILSKLHSDKLVEFDKSKSVVTISPLGIQKVEETLLTVN